MAPPEKSAGAFRTIGELSAQTGLPQHVLRYWESRFPQLRPLQRAGKRRYYRPEDVALVLRIHALLDQQGYTIRGVQKLLANERAEPAERAEGSEPRPSRPTRLRTLGDVRHSLRTALAADDNAARNGAATTI